VLNAAESRQVAGVSLGSGLGCLGDAKSEAPKAIRIAKYLGAMPPGTEWRAPKMEESMQTDSPVDDTKDLDICCIKHYMGSLESL